jgi:hypothetical protein
VASDPEIDIADHWLQLAGDPAASNADDEDDQDDADLEADLARDEAAAP